MVWGTAKTVVKDVLRVVLPLGCSVWLVVWLFSKVDFHQVVNVVGRSMTFWPLLAMLAFNFMSYIIRARRWGLQLKGAGIPTPPTELRMAIFGAYAMSLIINGLGEAWRCILVSHRQKASLSTVVGTDIGDRSSDLAVVILITVLAFILAAPQLDSFIDRYNLTRHIHHLLTNYWLWAAIAAVVTVWIIISMLFKGNRIVAAINTSLLNIWRGFAILFSMPSKGQYLILTVGIWICYFMQTYICFFAFPFTHHLLAASNSFGLVVGLVVLLFGSYSMAIPSSGGLGPWNIAVMFALNLYGVSEVDGTAFALVVWSGQALLQVVLGIVTLVWFYTSRPPRPGADPSDDAKKSVHP